MITKNNFDFYIHNLIVQGGDLMKKHVRKLTIILALSTFGCDFDSNYKDIPPPASVVVTGRGDVVIYESETKTAYFITKSGVLFKSVSLLKPENFSTYKSKTTKIHNTKDSLFVTAEWIGDKVFWDIHTNRLNTRNASNIGLTTLMGTEVIRLCTDCYWGPVFDTESGKTTHYSVSGITNNVSIDEWNAAIGVTYRATSAE